MRLYTSRSSAVRAAKKAGLSSNEYEIIEEAGKFGFRAIEADEVEEQVVEEEAAPEEVDVTPVELTEEAASEEAASEEVAEAPVEPAKKKTSKIDDRLRMSTIEAPSKRVWEIAEQMKAENPNVRRKDVIAACVEQGIAFYTARTQYQLWFKASRAS